MLLNQFKEKQIFDAAGQPFAPINITNALCDNSGLFTDASEVTTLLSLDKSSDTDASSSLMFKADELALEKHVDSIAD